MLRGGKVLAEAGHEVHYVFGEDLLSRRVPHRARRLLAPLAVVRRVVALHRVSPLDVVEVHEPLGAWYGLLAASSFGRKVLPPMVVLSHGLEDRCWRTTLEHRSRHGVTTPRWSRISVRWTLLVQARVALSHAAHVVVLNSEDRRILLARGMNEARVSVVPNGVDQSLFEIGHSPSAHLRFVFLGSWIERKGISALTEAWEEVHCAHPGVTLTLAGVGNVRIEDHFSASSRTSVTTIPSVRRDDLPQLLSDHDVLVLPSWFEGMPLVALEAAAASLAVIAAGIPGVTDIFRPPNPEADGALLFSHRDHGGLAIALRRLAGDPALVSDLRQAGHARASSFSWETTALGLAAAYERAVISRAPASTTGGRRRCRRRRSARRHEPM